MLDYLFEHAHIVTQNPTREVLADGAIAVLGDTIVAVGNTQDVKRDYPQAETVIDCNGKAIFPGLINTHIHSFQNMLKGLGKDKDLFHWLNDMIGPCMIHMENRDIACGATLASLDAIRSGTTTLLDYQYANITPFAADAAIDAHMKTGIRLVYGRGYADTGAEQEWATKEEVESIDTILSESQRLYHKYASRQSDMFHLWMAPSAIWLCTEDCLRETGAFCKAYGLGMTAHISETPWDTEASCILHGDTELNVCKKLNLLDSKFLMVHCVTFSQEQMEIARQTGATVAYNPISNMYLASGVAPIPELLTHGVVVTVGTDGAASNNSNDMLENLKTGVLLQKVTAQSPTVLTAEHMLDMATVQGAEALGMSKLIGSLEVGKKADFFVFNPQRTAKATPMHDPVATLVYSSSPENIETVMINGVPVLLNGEVTTLQEEEELYQATCTAHELVRRAEL